MTYPQIAYYACRLEIRAHKDFFTVTTVWTLNILGMQTTPFRGQSTQGSLTKQQAKEIFPTFTERYITV